MKHKKEYSFYVYIMASSSGTLYVGVTNSLIRRVNEHREGKIEGFSKTYSCKKLVYYEWFQYVYSAFDREKEIKKWRREKKENLIKTINPHWNDLYYNLCHPDDPALREGRGDSGMTKKIGRDFKRNRV